MRSKDAILPGLLVLLVAAVAWSFFAKPADPETNFDAPDLAIRTGDKIVSLSDYKGKVVLIDFWATWCGPCAMSIPAIERLYQQYHGRGLEVMGASVDEDKTARLVPAYIKDMGITYAAGRLVNRDAAAQYPIKGIPGMVLVDRKGRGRYIQSGFNDAVEAELAAKVKSLLDE